MNHKTALIKVIMVEKNNSNVQKEYDMANNPINIGMEVSYLIGPIFSLKP